MAIAPPEASGALHPMFRRWSRAAEAEQKAARREADPRLAQVYAAEHCCQCGGKGFRERNGHYCGCVLRRVFRLALYHYRRFGAASRPSLRGMVYRADFAIAARVLAGAEARAFRLYYLDGLAWRDCSARMGVWKADFFDLTEAAAQTVGRELLRRGLAPLERYLDWGHYPVAPAAPGDGPYIWRSSLAAYVALYQGQFSQRRKAG